VIPYIFATLTCLAHGSIWTQILACLKIAHTFGNFAVNGHFGKVVGRLGKHPNWKYTAGDWLDFPFCRQEWAELESFQCRIPESPRRRPSGTDGYGQGFDRT
jgi:hypothetical protein